MSNKPYFERAAAALRLQLDENEPVLAESRIDEYTHHPDTPPASGYDYLILTPTRILIAKNTLTPNEQLNFQIPLPAIHAYANKPYKHQWIVTLQHHPIPRLIHRPPPEPSYPLQQVDDVTTRLRFSRINSHAAATLRELLAHIPELPMT